MQSLFTNRFLLTAFVLMSLIIVEFFGISHTLGMEMRKDGTMGSCLFNGKTEICPMAFSEHLSRWQEMFIAIPPKSNILTIFFVLISAIGAFLFFNLRHRLFLLLLSRLSDHWLLYIRQNPYLSLFSHLRESFSQGILNPKIYELANL